MAILLFVLSAITFFAPANAAREGHQTEALADFLACTVPFSAGAIVVAIRAVAKQLAQRFPRAGRGPPQAPLPAPSGK